MSINSEEKISVCLLTYNHVHMIEETLASIMDQSVDGFEIIVSDDCSTDGTWELVQQIAAGDERVRAVQPPENRGMPGNANYAVEQSDRPYIALLHHDDIYRTDLLERWVDVAERHPDVAFVFNAYGFEDTDEVHVHPYAERVDGRQFLEGRLFSGWGCPVRGTALIRRSCWDAVGGMHTQFNLLADVDLWMRLAARWAVGYVPEPLISVRQERPEDYPESYSEFSWFRQRMLYEIHAANHLDYYDLSTLRGALAWWRFRGRLSADIFKWLTYAVVRRQKRMLETSAEGASEYEWASIGLVRNLYRKLGQMPLGWREPRRSR
ncbi:glycosyltransferase family 2 protein [Persicimonas caeni]|nr:glycosyltransferase family A protein [Persicimonas caeni]